MRVITNVIRFVTFVTDSSALIVVSIGPQFMERHTQEHRKDFLGFGLGAEQGCAAGTLVETIVHGEFRQRRAPSPDLRLDTLRIPATRGRFAVPGFGHCEHRASITFVMKTT